MLVHNCNKCQMCFKCQKSWCDDYRNFINTKETVEDGWIIKRCPYCGYILSKFETLELLNKKNNEINN